MQRPHEEGVGRFAERMAGHHVPQQRNRQVIPAAAQLDIGQKFHGQQPLLLGSDGSGG